jgi:hypothetical protein
MNSVEMDSINTPFIVRYMSCVHISDRAVNPNNDNTKSDFESSLAMGRKYDTMRAKAIRVVIHIMIALIGLWAVLPEANAAPCGLFSDGENPAPAVVSITGMIAQVTAKPQIGLSG